MQEQCYVFVHDKDKLAKFFEEDADLVARRLEATNKRDRLAKANAAMANIQVERGGLGMGPTRVRVTVALGQAGLGLQLADEGGRLVVRGFRTMEGGPNPGVEAGIKAGDVIDQVWRWSFSSSSSSSSECSLSWLRFFVSLIFICIGLLCAPCVLHLVSFFFPACTQGPHHYSLPCFCLYHVPCAR